MSVVNIALSNPPCSHGFVGNTREARNSLRGQDCRLEVRNSPIPLHGSQAPSPALLPTTSCQPPHLRFQRRRQRRHAPAALQISFTTVSCKVPGLMLVKMKQCLSISLLPAPGSGALGSLCYRGWRGAAAEPQRSREAQAAPAPARPAAAGMTNTNSDLQ